MARNVTVQQIVDQVQLLCQDPGHALATETQYVGFISDEYTRLYAAYVEAEPDRYRTEATIAGITSTSAYALPADWYATIGVDYVSGSVRKQLRRLMEVDRNKYYLSGGDPDAYRVISTNVVLYPTPITGQSFTHIYLPTAPVLSSVSTSIDCRLGHERYLQFCVARILLNSENSYDGRWDEEIARTLAELKREANERYFRDIAVMRPPNEGRQGRAYPFAWPYGNWSRW